MSVSTDTKLDFRDVLIKPIHSTLRSRSEVSVMSSYAFQNTSFIWQGTPIMTSNMDTTGTFEMAEAMFKFKMITCIHKHYSLEEWKKFIDNQKKHPHMFNYIAISCGTSKDDLDKLESILLLCKARFICLDVANGYRDDFVETIKLVRNKWSDRIIIAGNVVTPEYVKIILEAGANIVKIGIGNGSACSTRMKTGIGYPQLSAILECHTIAKNMGGYILSDGGCSTPADIVKAFGAGADFVMCGGMFAGHTESGGELIKEENGDLYKEFYGMSSDTAMKKYSGGVAKYRTSEGLTIRMKYKGPIEDTLLDICGGIRSACTYLNSTNIRDLYDNIKFIKVNNIK